MHACEKGDSEGRVESLCSPISEFREEYELTRLILSMVSKDRMYSSFSGLPRVLLALLLVLRFPGENATELPAAKGKGAGAQTTAGVRTVFTQAQQPFSEPCNAP